MDHIANEVENVDEFAHYLKEVKAEFPAYQEEVNRLLRTCQQKSQLTLRAHLQVSRNTMINVLCEACSYLNVGRRKVRKYLTTCLHAALNRDRSKLVSGIFSPYIQANILEALTCHKHFNDDTSLEELRETLPSALVGAKHSHHKKKTVQQ